MYKKHNYELWDFHSYLLFCWDFPLIGTEFGEEDATKQKSVKKSAFSLNEGKAFSESRLW